MMVEVSEQSLICFSVNGTSGAQDSSADKKGSYSCAFKEHLPGFELAFMIFNTILILLLGFTKFAYTHIRNKGGSYSHSKAIRLLRSFHRAEALELRENDDKKDRTNCWQKRD